MPRTVSVTAPDRAALEHRRSIRPNPSLRERAAALLQIADGVSAHQVARAGGLHLRDPDTISASLDRYLTEGLAGLTMRPGRGRTPAFPPSIPSRAAALLEMVRRDPRGFGFARTRWTRAERRWPSDTPLPVLATLDAVTGRVVARRRRITGATWSRSSPHLQRPVRLLTLPTYASWLNPIKTLWRRLRQEVSTSIGGPTTCRLCARPVSAS